MKICRIITILCCILAYGYSSLGDEVPGQTQPDNNNNNCKVTEILQGVRTAVAGLGEEIKVLNVKTANISGQVRDSFKGHLEFLNQVPREIKPPSGNSGQTPRLKPKGFFESLIESPKAKLYKGTHFTGEVTNYDFNNPENSAGGCYHPDGNWKSVDPGQSCVRLFYRDGCQGNSVALYPGSNNNANVDSLLTNVWSVGPCLVNELAFATFTNTSAGITVSKDTSNLLQVPDFMDIGGYTKYRSNSVSNYMSSNYPGSSYQYYVENERRLMYLFAIIKKKHVERPVSGAFSSFVTQRWNQLSKHRGDQMGLVIPTSLGGLRNETFNIFPQSPANAVEWKKVTDRALEIFQTPCAYQGATISVNFYYANTHESRPYALAYHLDLCGYGMIENGFIPN